MQLDSKKLETLKNISQGDHEWASVRKDRISSSLLRKAITNTESILDSINNEDFFDLITVGFLVETLAYKLMPRFLCRTGLWVDPELHYIVGSPDGICTIEGKRIPVEIKSTKSSKSIERIISEYYYQLQSYISFLDSDKLLLIYYEIDAKKLNVVLVDRDKDFKKKYYPLVERSYWKFLAKKHFDKMTNTDYYNFISSAKWRAGILKYYDGDFSEDKKALTVPPKFIRYTHVRLENFLTHKCLDEVKKMVNQYHTGLNFDKLNEVTGDMFYYGKESYITQKIEQTEAFLGSVRRYLA